MIGELYDLHVLPRVVDAVCGAKNIQRQRAKVVPRAWGEVLELGIGTGLNLAHYDRSRVTRIVGVDPGVHPLAASRANELDLEVETLALTAERIPAPDASFDSVVVTYTLCTIPHAVSALREAARVLRPGGSLFFCEHGLAPDADVRAWQRRLDRPWSRIAGGCHLDRDVLALLRDGGFDVVSSEQRYLPGPRFFGFNTWGEARPQRG